MILAHVVKLFRRLQPAGPFSFFCYWHDCSLCLCNDKFTLHQKFVCWHAQCVEAYCMWMQKINSTEMAYSGRRLNRSGQHQQTELRISDLRDSELSKSSRFLSETIPHVDSAKLRSTAIISETTTGKSMTSSSDVSSWVIMLTCIVSIYACFDCSLGTQKGDIASTSIVIALFAAADGTPKLVALTA